MRITFGDAQRSTNLIPRLNTGLKKRFSGLDEHTLEILGKSSSSLLVRILGLVASFGVSVGLGRALGVTDFGIISLSLQITSLLLVLTMLGMDNVLIKRIAIGYERQDSQQIADSFYTSSVINGLLASGITVLGILSAPWACRHIFHSQKLEIPLIIAMVVIVPQTFSRIFASSLSGFRRIWQSNLVNNTLSIWVVGLGLVTLYCFKAPITVVSVAVLYAIGRLFVFSSTGIYWRKLFRYSGPRRLIARPMLATAIPLLLATSAFIILTNADGVMLGWLRSSRAVGLYSVAAKVASLESFLLFVSNSAISPKLASLYAEGKLREMETMVRRVMGGLFLIAVVGLAIFVVFGHFLLSIWGHEFAEAYWILVILGIGQFFNMSTGCSGMLLAMCDQEKVLGYVSAVSLLCNLILNYILILAWGAVGVAIATAITVIGDNIAKIVLAKRRIGILSIPVRNLFS